LLDFRPKWELPLGNKPVIEHILDRLQPQVADIIINGSANQLEKYNYHVVNDSIKDSQGPLAGLLAGLEYAKEHHFRWVATCPCDSPFFPLNYVEVLAKAIEQPQTLCVIAKNKGRTYGVFGLWSIDLIPKLQNALSHTSQRSIGVWARLSHANAIAIDFSLKQFLNDNQSDPFFNINTHEDWLEAQNLNLTTISFLMSSASFEHCSPLLMLLFPPLNH